jgi:lysophospholipase L1-like esterase
VDEAPWSVDGSSLVFVGPGRLLDGPWHRLAVTWCGGYVEVLGVDLRSGASGVVLDTFGLNGAELGWLSRWEPAVRRLLLERADPSLIVVSYGTNDMGRGDLEAEAYRAEAARIFFELRRDAPRAALLVTGPIDRGHRKKREAARLRANADLVIGALRRAAADTGAAFWDARGAMGGPGSIGRWAAKGWAQRDRVHLTGTGYAELARLLFVSLQGAADGERRAAGTAP